MLTARVSRADLWTSRYEELLSYFKQYGKIPLQVSSSHPDYSLFKWVDRQRQEFNLSKLTKERHELLLAAGVPFGNLNEMQWDGQFKSLQKFRSIYGHVNVPHDYECEDTPESPWLGRWVEQQRVQRKTGRLLPEREALLEAEGFLWSYRDSVWDARFEDLQPYHRKWGNCKISSKQPTEPALASWFHQQTRRLREGLLKEDQVMRLVALGVDAPAPSLHPDEEEEEGIQQERPRG